jgi:PEP-CTERM motif
MKCTAIGCCLFLALCCVPAHADILIAYSDSGTFSPTTPSDAFGFSGPNETWAFSFVADSNPTPLSDVGMGGFNFAFSDFSYTLDGSPVAITPTFIRFFSGTNFGGFAICFDGTIFATCTEGLATDGPQMYTGTTSTPTLTPGAFLQYGLGALVGGTTYGEANPTTLVATAVPEPSTVLPILIAMGLLALGGRRRYWRS